MIRRHFLKAACAAVLGLFGATTARGSFTLKGKPAFSGPVAEEVVDYGVYRYASAGPVVRFPTDGWNVDWPTHILGDA